MRIPPDFMQILADFPKHLKNLGDLTKYSDNYDLFMYLQKDTNTYITIITYEPQEIIGVYFGETFKYLVKNPNDKFYQDIENKTIDEINKYESEDIIND